METDLVPLGDSKAPTRVSEASLAALDPFKWQKGVSGNPGGRRKTLQGTVRDVCGQDGRKLIEALAAIALGHPDALQAVFGDALDVTEIKIADRLACLKELLDRGWGKPQQSVELTGDGENPLAIALVERIIRHGPDTPD